MSKNKTVDELNLSAAGQVFERYALKQELNLERWAKRFGVHPNTARAIANGSYNSGMGPTMGLLDHLGDGVSNGDRHVKRMFVYEYLAKANLLPVVAEISVVGELALLQKQLTRIARMEASVHARLQAKPKDGGASKI